MTTSTCLWGLNTISIILTANFLIYLIKINDSIQSSYSEFSENLVDLLSKCYSFIEIVDSKLIGLVLFLIANIFTGIINLSIDNDAVGWFYSILILSLNSILSRLVPVIFYYMFKLNKSNKIFI
jgi:hypothetical protein